MSVLVNITTSDRLHEPGFRYRRDKLVVTHEQFKGAVTRIINVPDIARQLQISTDDLTTGLERFIKKALAISTCGPLMFPGRLDAAKLDQVLQKMIEKFILCPKCRLPEWNKIVCRACGYSKEPASSTGLGRDISSATETVTIKADEQWERELASMMHRLYTLRHELQQQSSRDESRLRHLDQALNVCWTLKNQAEFNHFGVSALYSLCNQ